MNRVSTNRVPRVGYEVYFIRFLLFPFHFIIPYCYFVHGIKMHFVLFFFLDRIKRGSERKKKEKKIETHSARIIIKRKIFIEYFPSIIVSMLGKNRIIVHYLLLYLGYD